MQLPKIIALCGKPLAGKTTAAELLVEAYGYNLVDDGLPLRQMAMAYLGLTEHQVFTQAGKKERVELNGRTFTAREILGEIGNAFEEKFGGDVIPMMSHNLMDPEKYYVLQCVRREQGHYWRRHGGIVIEIDNPGALPSPYEFDCYSKSAVTHTVLNDGPHRGLCEDDALMLLMQRLAEVLEA